MRISINVFLIAISLALAPCASLSAPPTRWQSFKELTNEDPNSIWHFYWASVSALSVLTLNAYSENAVRDSLNAADAGDFTAWNHLLKYVVCAGVAGACGYHIKGFRDQFETYHQERLAEYSQTYESIFDKLTNRSSINLRIDLR